MLLQTLLKEILNTKIEGRSLWWMGQVAPSIEFAQMAQLLPIAAPPLILPQLSLLSCAFHFYLDMLSKYFPILARRAKLVAVGMFYLAYQIDICCDDQHIV